MAAAPGAEHDSTTLLSDIIVTTGDGEVDLSDSGGARACSPSSSSDEIELAKACRDQAQTLDAILQLTEAEKICEALGLDEQLAEVRALLAGAAGMATRAVPGAPRQSRQRGGRRPPPRGVSS